MKNTHTCPKCQSKDIVRIPTQAGLHANRSVVLVGWGPGVMVTRYVCCACGFSEEWIDAPEDRAKLHEHFAAEWDGSGAQP